MKFDFSYTIDALPRLLEGALITVQVTLISFVLSLLLATLLTVVRNSVHSRVLELVLAIYISFIRGTPILIQIFLIYYVLPIVGIDIGPFVAGIMAITLNSAAYVVEIFRGALAAIPRGQFEAARSLGLPTPTLWLRVVLPQLLFKSIPPLVNEFTLVAKATPLLATITVVEMMRVSQQIYSSNFHPVEVLLGAFVIYFLICFSISRLAGVLEQRLLVRQG
ncbi:MAG: amino acid ABC transporter permease [Gammaproteobacteria bacterium]|nr:amino acid ABC transporter permease [Gammaproteobacteria bacterium]